MFSLEASYCVLHADKENHCKRVGSLEISGKDALGGIDDNKAVNRYGDTASHHVFYLFGGIS